MQKCGPLESERNYLAHACFGVEEEGSRLYKTQKSLYPAVWLPRRVVEINIQRIIVLLLRT